MWLTWTIAQAVCSEEDTATTKAYITTDLDAPLGNAKKYVIPVALSNTPACPILNLKKETMSALVEAMYNKSAYRLKENNIMFPSGDSLFQGGQTRTEICLKSLYTALCARVHILAAPDAKFIPQLSLPQALASPAAVESEARRDIHKDIEWFATKAQAKEIRNRHPLGISAIIALLLVTGEFGVLNSAVQSTLMAWLRPIDAARFLAIALLCRIPRGLLRWLPCIVACKRLAGYQLLLAARAFAQLLSTSRKSALFPRVKTFLGVCLLTIQLDKAISREMWWYAHVLDCMFTRDPFKTRVRSVVDLGVCGATIQQHSALRNEWPPALWEEQAYQELRVFTFDMVTAFKDAADCAGLPPTRSTFFEWCVPNASFITLARALLYNLRFENNSTFLAEDSAAFARHALNSVQALFCTWLRRRLPPISAVDALFAVLQDSRASGIVPELMEVYRTHYAAAPPALETGPSLLFPAPAAVQRETLPLAPMARPTAAAGCVQLHPPSGAAAMWLALVAPIVSKMSTPNASLEMMYPMSMLTMDIVPRFTLLRQALCHLYSGARAKYRATGNPKKALDLFQESSLGTFAMYLLYDKAVLRIIDGAVVPAGSPNRLWWSESAHRAAAAPVHVVPEPFSEEGIAGVCRAVAEIWHMHLAIAVHPQYIHPHKNIFVKAAEMPELKMVWARNCYWHFLAGMLSSARLRGVLKAQIKANTTTLTAICAIWDQLVQEPAASPRVLRSMPAVPPLLYSHGASDLSSMRAVNTVAMLRLSRFLLENMNSAALVPDETISSVIADSIAALLRLVSHSESEIITRECLVQLVLVLRIPSAIETLRNETLTMQRGLQSMTDALLAENGSQASQKKRAVLIELRSAFQWLQKGK